MIQVTPVILCGGAGTRLWPLSRGGFPKQFLSLNGNETLLKQASKRLMQLGNADIQISKPLIVTGEEHLFLAVEQLREIDIEVGIALLEPKCRNTPTALTLAAQLNGEDPVLVVTPADQVITNLVVFTQAVQEAKHEASGGRIVILGITPDEPEIGYGYIEAHGRNHQGALQMKCFVEKPVVITAQNYLNEGGYFWNVGMFVLKASVRLRALEAFRPDVFDLTNQL
jgi:mannose-1-phosphate guanylyltransferase/mannose-6-phosphate isomerase